MFQSMRWALAALALGVPGLVSAQEFPVRPITMVVPWPAGGSTDTQMRRFSEVSSKYLGQQVVVENRPGGGGTLGPGTMAQTDAKYARETFARERALIERLGLLAK